MLVLIKPMTIHTAYEEEQTERKTNLVRQHCQLKKEICNGDIVELFHWSQRARKYIYTAHNAGRYNSLSHRLKNSLRTHNRCISQSISIYSKKMNGDKLKLFGDRLSPNVLFFIYFCSYLLLFYIILFTRFLLTLYFIPSHSICAQCFQLSRL